MTAGHPTDTPPPETDTSGRVPAGPDSTKEAATTEQKAGGDGASA